MRLLATWLIGIGVAMLISALLGAIWLIWMIGPEVVWNAPDVRITLGWQGVLYFVIAVVALGVGLMIRRRMR